MGVAGSTDAAMTSESFLDFSQHGSDGSRYELVDGRVHAMAPERAVHARTKNAVTRAFEAAIVAAGLPCEAFVDGMAVRVDAHCVFEPDVLVRCGPRLDDDAIVVVDPVIVVEVASPSTQRIDALTKLTRYFRNSSIVHYLIVMPKDRSVLHHKRGGGDRIETTIANTGILRLDPPGLEVDVGTFFLAASCPEG